MPRVWKVPEEYLTGKVVRTDAKREEVAQSKLHFGKRLLDGKKPDKARKWFEGVIAEFPNTLAVEEARQLLAKIDPDAEDAA